MAWCLITHWYKFTFNLTLELKTAPLSGLYINQSPHTLSGTVRIGI